MGSASVKKREVKREVKESTLPPGEAKRILDKILILEIEKVDYGPNIPAGGRDKVQVQNTDDYPVENVSWAEASDFCKRLSTRMQEMEAARRYRLPTDNEWDYACREASASTTPFQDVVAVGVAW